MKQASGTISYSFPEDNSEGQSGDRVLSLTLK